MLSMFPGNKYKLKAPDGGVKEVSAEQKLAEQELIEDSKKWLEASEARDDDEGVRKTTGSIPLTQVCCQLTQYVSVCFNS